METKQTNKLNMQMSVRNFKRQNDSEASQIPKFCEAFDLLMKTTDELQLLSEKQGKERKGVTMDKNLLKKNLIDLCLKNSNRLAILSLQKENYTLLKEIQFRESQLANMKGLKLVEKAQLIYSNVQSNLEVLAEQGLSADTQKELNDAITSFNNFLSMPRTAIAERSHITTKIDELFASSDKYLKIMDFAVESAKKDHPDFYRNYKAARVLVDSGSRSLALKASVKEMPKGIPLGGVAFIFRHKESGTEVKKRTTGKGNFHIKNIKPGPWKVFVSKKGYKNHELEIDVDEKEINLINIEMEKA